MGDDVHNPFGDNEPRREKKGPGIFDPDYQGDDDDPFRSTPDDGHWDEEEEQTSTRDA